MKAYGGVDVQSHSSGLQHLLEVSGQLHAPAALPPGKEPRYPLDGTLGGPQSRSGRGENSCPYWDSNSDPSVIQPIASPYSDYASPVLNEMVQIAINYKLRRTNSKIYNIEHVVSDIQNLTKQWRRKC
jgi:hypothetical protein